MRRFPLLLSSVLLPPTLLMLTACANLGDRAAAGGDAAVEIPADAVATTRAGANGDQIIEYRVAGQLRVVKVIPLRGPPYYLQDRNGDGRIDEDRNVSPVYFKIFEW